VSVDGVVMAGVPGPDRAAWRDLVRVRLEPGDELLVEEGEHLEAGTPLLHRARHPQVAEHALHGAPPPPAGTRVADGRAVGGSGRGVIRFEGAGEILYATPGGRLRAVVSRHQAIVSSPVAGTIVRLDACELIIAADGTALPAVIAEGEPSHGPLVVAVDGPDAELRATQIDVRHAGAILVVGSRVDVESMTRARAMGIRGVVAGGIVGTDLFAFRASLDRQEASIHASPPFALVVLDGYGKRPIPPAAWEALVAADGTDVGLSVTPPLVLLGPGVALPPRRPGRVRVAAGPLLGRAGRVVELLGPRRRPAGTYLDCARVVLDPGPGEDARVVDLPLADLESDA
jgi:hypothetical protein